LEETNRFARNGGKLRQNLVSTSSKGYRIEEVLREEGDTDKDEARIVQGGRTKRSGKLILNTLGRAWGGNRTSGTSNVHSFSPVGGSKKSTEGEGEAELARVGGDCTFP